MFLVHNEQTKLTASWLNSLAAALVAAGVFAPVAALMYRFAPIAIDYRSLVVMALGCFGLGGVLHLLGWAFLRRLRE